MRKPRRVFRRNRILFWISTLFPTGRANLRNRSTSTYPKAARIVSFLPMTEMAAGNPAEGDSSLLDHRDQIVTDGRKDAGTNGVTIAAEWRGHPAGTIDLRAGRRLRQGLRFRFALFLSRGGCLPSCARFTFPENRTPWWNWRLFFSHGPRPARCE